MINVRGLNSYIRRGAAIAYNNRPPIDFQPQTLDPTVLATKLSGITQESGLLSPVLKAKVREN